MRTRCRKPFFVIVPLPITIRLGMLLFSPSLLLCFTTQNAIDEGMIVVAIWVASICNNNNGFIESWRKSFVSFKHHLYVLNRRRFSCYFFVAGIKLKLNGIEH